MRFIKFNTINYFTKNYFKMGNSQSVDFKDFESKNALRKYMEKIDQDMQDFKETQKKLLEESHKKNPSDKFNQVVENYFEAETVCNVPPFINWMVPSQRSLCKDAKIKFIKSAVELVDDVSTKVEMKQMIADTNQKMQFLQKLKENEKYL